VEGVAWGIGSALCFWLALSFVVHGTRVAIDNDFIRQTSLLYPLTSVQRLLKLNIPQTYPCQLNDSSIENIAKASPNLAVLNIGTSSFITGYDPALARRILSLPDPLP
jgi:hypothetical protein